MPLDSFFNAFSDIQTVMGYIGTFSWFLLPFMLMYTVAALWLAYVQAHYMKSTKYVLIEIKPPREVRKTPRAMEQVFTAIHALRSGPELGMFFAMLNEKWWNGEVVLPYSAEIVSFGGEVRFYLWIPEKHRNIIEAAIYSHYLDAEIKVVDDYVNRLPPTFAELKKRNYEIFGTEFLLAKDDAYPIRTFTDFETIAEEKELDPISGVMEVMAKIRPEDTIWLQIIIKPLIEDEPEKLYASAKKILDKIKAESRAVKDEKTGEVYLVQPNPAELEAMKAISRKIEKPAFKTVIRTLYIGPKEGFSSNFGQRGIFSAFNQYAIEAYNKFKNNSLAWSRASMWYPPYFFPRRRLIARKERLMDNYRKRKIYDDTRAAKLLNLQLFDFGGGGKMFISNTEELATLYHLPTFIVMTGPMVKKEESRKVGPPAGLPIFGDNDQKLPGIG